MTSEEWKAVGGALVFFLFGGIAILLGISSYRRRRLIQDIPRARIRGIPMGLVHVEGRAKGETRLKSPLTGAPCFYYKVAIEKYQPRSPEDHRNEWAGVGGEEKAIDFYLEDTTGRVLVKPDRAVWMVDRTFVSEIGSAGSGKRYVQPALGAAGATDSELNAYIAKTVMPALQKGSFRLTEECLIAGRLCNIVGSCAENPNPKDGSDHNMIHKGPDEDTFMIADRADQIVEKNLNSSATLMILIGSVLLVLGVVAMVTK